jgi:DNA polymerase III delta prime subunit
MKAVKDLYWVEKYRPDTIDGYIFHDEHQKQKILEFIHQQNFPHLFLSGIRGSGKTTLITILLNEITIDPSDVLIINASDQTSIENVREDISKFAKTSPNGEFKVIVLEECDFISFNAQGALRRVMDETYENTRFILTCNYEYKVIPELISRAAIKFRFKAPDKNDIAERLVKILVKEKVVFSMHDLDDYIDFGYPDIRNSLSYIQQYTVNNVLQPFKQIQDVADYKPKLVELLNQNKWADARKLVCSSVVKEEYDEIYRYLYDNLDNIAKFKDKTKWDNGILMIGDYLDKHSRISDSEINLACLFISLETL